MDRAGEGRVDPGRPADPTSPGAAFGAVQSFPDPARFLLGRPTGIVVTQRSGPVASGGQKSGPSMIESEM
ncbi:hypothetical protein GCM10010517_04410 [Streptosporangium fragile]|uniref:Uncharacterized protein n=1 Tax=Streptosporangium fragile TaxID=46186 RepID=A0ABN3VPM2_9ACTN